MMDRSCNELKARMRMGLLNGSSKQLNLNECIDLLIAFKHFYYHIFWAPYSIPCG